MQIERRRLFFLINDNNGSNQCCGTEWTLSGVQWSSEGVGSGCRESLHSSVHVLSVGNNL